MKRLWLYRSFSDSRTNLASTNKQSSVPGHKYKAGFRPLPLPLPFRCGYQHVDGLTTSVRASNIDLNSIWRLLMEIIACLLFFSSVAGFAPAQPQSPAPQFSANVVMWNKRGSPAHMKLFVGNKKSRLDRGQDLSGYHSVQSLIVDSEAHTVLLLIPDKKSYVESSKLAADFSHGASIFRPKDPSNPCAEWIELERKYNNLELRCRKLGDETLGGRRTEKWEGSATPAGGWGDIWFDPELRYVIKLWSYPRESALLRGYDLEQIELAPQPDSLFELPDGYVRMSLADFKSLDSATSR
jgi:hypothetical protein